MGLQWRPLQRVWRGGWFFPEKPAMMEANCLHEAGWRPFVAVETLYLSDHPSPPPPQAAAPTPFSIYLHQSKILKPGTFLSPPLMFFPYPTSSAFPRTQVALRAQGLKQAEEPPVTVTCTVSKVCIVRTYCLFSLLQDVTRPQTLHPIKFTSAYLRSFPFLSPRIPHSHQDSSGQSPGRVPQAGPQ